MKRMLAAILVLVVLAGVTGCMTHVHKVGNGPQGNQIVQERQWYVLWGLVPINDVDSEALADGADDYEIITQAAPLDIVINIFTGWITVYSRTVTVTK